ncbi:hypothetical protein V8E53_013509, partial [Lactarius tabidus]
MDPTSPFSPTSSGLETSHMFNVLSLESFDFAAALGAAFSEEDLEEDAHSQLSPEPPSSMSTSSGMSGKMSGLTSGTQFPLGNVKLTGSTSTWGSKKNSPTGNSIHAHRRRKEFRKKKSNKIAPHIQIRPIMIKRHAKLMIYKTTFNAFDLPHTKGGWLGRRITKSTSQTGEETIESLMSDKYKYVPIESPSLGIADKHGYIFVIRRAPPPTSPDQKPWSESIMDLEEAMKDARTMLHVPVRNLNHRRGKYEYVSGGISYGGGQKTPMNMSYQSKHQKAIAENLLKNQDLNRIASYVN